MAFRRYIINIYNIKANIDQLRALLDIIYTNLDSLEADRVKSKNNIIMATFEAVDLLTDTEIDIYKLLRSVDNEVFAGKDAASAA